MKSRIWDILWQKEYKLLKKTKITVMREKDVRVKCNVWETRLDHALKRGKVMNDIFGTTGENWMHTRY